MEHHPEGRLRQAQEDAVRHRRPPHSILLKPVEAIGHTGIPGAGKAAAVLAFLVFFWSGPPHVFASHDLVYYSSIVGDLHQIDRFEPSTATYTTLYTALPSSHAVTAIAADSKGNVYASVEDCFPGACTVSRLLRLSSSYPFTSTVHTASDPITSLEINSKGNLSYSTIENDLHKIYRLDPSFAPGLLYTAPQARSIVDIASDSLEVVYAAEADCFPFACTGTDILKILPDGSFRSLLTIPLPLTSLDADRDGMQLFFAALEGDRHKIFRLDPFTLQYAEIFAADQGWGLTGLATDDLGTVFTIMQDCFPHACTSAYLVNLSLSGGSWTSSRRKISVFPVTALDIPHHVPVLMVHGIYSDDAIWDVLEQELKRGGLVAYRVGDSQAPDLNSPQPGLVPNNGHINELASQVKIAIDNIKAHTGARKVNVVAHSMGGLVSRWYLQSAGYTNDLNTIVTLGTPNEGAPIAKHPLAALFGVALGIGSGSSIVADHARKEMIPGSWLLTMLNSRPPHPGVQHAEIGGTITNPLVCLPNLQPSYCFDQVFLGKRTDSIVPLESVNIPLITCYEKAVVHARPLRHFSAGFSTPFESLYDDAETIDSTRNILKDLPPSLGTCSELDNIASPTSIQFLTVKGTTAPGQSQPAASIDPGKRFGAFLNWSTQGLLNLELVSPSGAVVNASTFTLFPGVNYTFLNGSALNTSAEWLFVDAPEAGVWTVRVRGTSLPSPAPFDLAVMVEADLSLAAAASPSRPKPAESVLLSAVLLNGTSPVGAAVAATVTLPDGIQVVVPLYDDGLHGDGGPNDGMYANNFTNSSLEGTYVSMVNASLPGLLQMTDSTVFFVEQFPDLEITGNDLSFSPPLLTPGRNATVAVSATLRNTGEKDATNVTVDFFDGDPAGGGTLFASSVLSLLPANQSAVVSATLHVVFSSRPVVDISGSPRIGSTLAFSFSDSAFRYRDIHAVVGTLDALESDYSDNSASAVLAVVNASFLLLMGATGTSPGIRLADGRVIPVNYDGLTGASLFSPSLIGLSNSQGVLDSEGKARTIWSIPALPAIAGLTVSAAYVTFDPSLAVPQAITSFSAPASFSLLP